MSVHVLYFAWLRERIGLAGEDVETAAPTVAGLVAELRAREERYALAFADMAAVRVAVDQELSDLGASLAGAREVAFFPADDGRLMAIRVQEQDFDLGAELAALRAGRTDIGALVSFTGLVRDLDGRLTAFELEHYPGMTFKALAAIEGEARARWPLQASLVVHRFGALRPGDQIMMVAVASAHREAAFAAAAFLMDYLKSRAPFWKKEITAGGEAWVDAREADEAALARWEHLG